MAQESRHAAWHNQYDVREVLEGEPVLDLGLRHSCRDYLDAVQLALDYLHEHDPERDGAVSGLRIECARGNGRETVWSYSAEQAGPAAGGLQHRWGYDVQRWGVPTQAA